MDPITIAAIAGASGMGLNALQGRKQNKEETERLREYQGRLEDIGMRTEATYRTNRSMLQSAIADFYKQKGWELPEAIPGAGTTRPLPGEEKLYPDYEANVGDWYYGKVEPKEKDEEEDTEKPEEIGGGGGLPLRTKNPVGDVAGTAISRPVTAGISNAISDVLGMPAAPGRAPMATPQSSTLNPSFGINPITTGGGVPGGGMQQAINYITPEMAAQFQPLLARYGF